jgi:predicted nucleic acid-binding protein
MPADEPPTQPDFADTNVWLYALLETQDQQKCARANQIIRDASLAVSTQLINEICVNLLRRAAFSETQIQRLIEAFYQRHRVVRLDRETLVRASSLRTNYSLSFWDSLMIAGALQAGASVFYSEDLHHGLLVEGTLRIVNPFRTAQVTSS